MSDHTNINNLTSPLQIPILTNNMTNENDNTQYNMANVHMEGTINQNNFMNIRQNLGSRHESNSHMNMTINTRENMTSPGGRTMISDMTQRTDDSRIRNGQNVEEVLRAATGIDQEVECKTTKELVRKCVKEELWNDVKFLTERTIRMITTQVSDNRGSSSILDKLIKRTKPQTLTKAEKIMFWETYSEVVKAELNNLKTNCTKFIKDNVLKGKKDKKYISICIYIYF